MSSHHHPHNLKKHLLYRGKLPHRHTNCHSLPQSSRHLFASLLCITSLALWLTLIVTGLSHLNQSHSLASPHLFTLLALILTSQLLSYLIRRRCVCPLCRGKTLIQGRSQKHKKAFCLTLLNYNLSTMLSILSLGAFRCIHCGTPFILGKGHRCKKQ